MSKLDDILWGVFHEGEANQLADLKQFTDVKFIDEHTAKQQIKDLIQELIDETFDSDDMDAYRLWEKIKAL